MQKRKRKRSALYYARSVTGQVWNHPANRGRRLRALGRAVWWQARKRLVPKPAIVQMPRGVRILCYPDNTIASQIWYFGPYIEWDELLFMTRYLRAGDGVIDAGANIGLYTLLAAPIVGPEGRVDSFEPGKIAVERLMESIELNSFGQVHLHQAAVSDSEGVVSFATGWDVSNSMIPDSASKAGSLLVTATTLDESVPHRVYAYAKLDVEGAEGLALRGAKRMLADHNPPVWQVELCEHMLRRFGSDPEEVLAMFRENGYVTASYDADSNILAPAQYAGGNANLLAISADRWEWVTSRLT